MFSAECSGEFSKNWFVSKDLTSKRTGYVGIWQKRIPGRENSKSSEAGMHPTNCGTAKGMAWLEPRVKGTTGKTKNLIRQGLVGH